MDSTIVLKFFYLTLAIFYAINVIYDIYLEKNLKANAKLSTKI